MGYPLTGYLYSDFQQLDLDEIVPGAELYLVKADGRYRIVRDLAAFDEEEEAFLGPDDGVWAVDRRERLLAFRIRADGVDVVASVMTAVADIQAVFGADLTDGVERLGGYFRRLHLLGPAELRVGGGEDADSARESANDLRRELAQSPPDLPGMRISIQEVEPYSEWLTTGVGELVDVH